MSDDPADDVSGLCRSPVVRSFSLPNGSKITSLRESALCAGLKAASLALKTERALNQTSRVHGTLLDPEATAEGMLRMDDGGYVEVSAERAGRQRSEQSMTKQISTAAAEAEILKWQQWSERVGCELPRDHVVADVVLAYASLLVPNGEWFSIESLPEGRHIQLYWPKGERGVGGIECATVFCEGDDWSYWTHGGPNSGSDWEPANNERPTHWRPLPEPPSS